MKKNNNYSRTTGIISQRSGLQSMGEPLSFALGFKQDKKIKNFLLKKLSRKTLKDYEPVKYRRIIDMVFKTELLNPDRNPEVDNDLYRPFFYLIHFKRINCIYHDHV